MKHLPRANRLKRITAKSPAVSRAASPQDLPVIPAAQEIPHTPDIGPDTVLSHTPDIVPVRPSSSVFPHPYNATPLRTPDPVPRRKPNAVRLRPANAMLEIDLPPGKANDQGENAHIASAPSPEVITTPVDNSPGVLDKKEFSNMLPQLRERGGKAENLFIASWQSALEAILLNRSRSLLTVLSIFIGVASVIAVLTLTQGAGLAINRTLAYTGPNTLLISSYSVSSGTGSSRSLTLEDALALEHLLHVSAVSPIVSLQQERVTSPQRQWQTDVQGVSANFSDMLQLQVANGLWFSLIEEKGGKALAVLGHTAAQQLFGSETNPVGKTIRIRNQSFKVIGVLAPKGGSSAQDDAIFVPFRTVLNTSEGRSGLNMIQVQVDAAAHMDRVQQASALQLLKNHATPVGIPADFQMETSSQLLQRAQQITGIFTLLFVGIAAISLTIGGIGIMNIMLVSVAERAYEIGVRIMLGARRSDIRNQFLLEALTLCMVSSVIGLGLGLLAGLILVRSLQMPFVMSITTFLVPFVVSAAIGIIFGLYPAMRAARLDPIGALRSDE